MANEDGKYRALVLAAGEGTRMYPLTEKRPKPMIKVAGKPLLLWVLETLKNRGITEVVMVVGWEGKRIKDYFGDGKRFGLDIKYVYQEKRMGTAHATLLGEKFLGDGAFLSVNGDVIITEEMVDTVLQRHRETGLNVVGVAEVRDPRGFGIVHVENGLIKEIEEKPDRPTRNTINSGIYVLKPDIFSLVRETPLSARGEYEITDTFKLAIEKEGVAAAILPGEWVDVGRPWDLLEANRVLMDRVEMTVDGDVEEGARLIGPVKVGKGASIKSGSYVEGPVIIDEGAKIGPNCYIRPHTYIGKRCHVGAAVEIKNSIIMDDTKVPHHNYVGDSVIGERCNFGSGTKLANLRFDDRPVRVVVKGELVDSGRRKLGAIVGDDVKTGVNVSVDPGTVIGCDVWISPGAYVRGFISSKTFVK